MKTIIPSAFFPWLGFLLLNVYLAASSLALGPLSTEINEPLCQDRGTLGTQTYVKSGLKH